ncbi:MULTISPECIES: Rap1a/Tai family immunity protein [unclassified Sphingomonas]|uniref:Rap1a/Tai family immunity protein n=1 Tax=unclassified Sphingomonas TaxID=196159 RepID=UPI000E765F5E|nr:MULTISPECIES: Rap1a/Tai family immunity protein [unclassified Sphingomonas]RKE54030.1 hypothetical protein C8J39_1185 [Sphingomonas sp. PP-CC-1A-547]TCM10573.1 hypothetical protein C8J41_1011089 [Sphingomonas sp. PP-CC-3G-468]
MVMPLVLLLAAPLLVQSQKPNGPVPQASAPQASTSQVSAGPLAGGLFSAGQLRQRCLSNVPADASYCFAYITGVHDTVRAYEAWLNQREFCVPRHVPQGDLRQAFIDYLRDKPSDLSGEAASVVVVALKIRYACGSGARGAPPAPARSGKP